MNAIEHRPALIRPFSWLALLLSMFVQLLSRETIHTTLSSIICRKKLAIKKIVVSLLIFLCLSLIYSSPPKTWFSFLQHRKRLLIIIMLHLAETNKGQRLTLNRQKKDARNCCNRVANGWKSTQHHLMSREYWKQDGQNELCSLPFYSYVFRVCVLFTCCAGNDKRTPNFPGGLHSASGFSRFSPSQSAAVFIFIFWFCSCCFQSQNWKIILRWPSPPLPPTATTMHTVSPPPSLTNLDEEHICSLRTNLRPFFTHHRPLCTSGIVGVSVYVFVSAVVALVKMNQNE